MNDYLICRRCVMDSSVADIEFDENGICNYCHYFDQIIADMPLDEKGSQYLNNVIQEAKQKGRKKPYDVVIGVSGGVDSSFLVYYAIQKGLRVLAVNLDNGWHSEIAVSNIKNVLNKFGVDLVTYVVNYEEMKDVLLSFMKAGLPWIDAPTDLAIISSLYTVAMRYHIKTIFVGNNIRTEGKQPTLWTYTDSRQIRYVQKHFGKIPIKSLPLMSPISFFKAGFVQHIKMIRPLNYMRYDKKQARTILEKEYGWKDYGGHHHESIFTKFAIAYWLPGKFHIDKRKVTFSAQIRSGLLDRQQALAMLQQPPYNPEQMEEDKEYVIKKLGITNEIFDEIWKAPNKSIMDYPSYLKYLTRYAPFLQPLATRLLSFKPMMFANFSQKNKST